MMVKTRVSLNDSMQQTIAHFADDPLVRAFHRHGLWVMSLLFFVLIFWNAGFNPCSLTILGKPYPTLGAVLAVCLSALLILPFSVLFGFGACQILAALGRRLITVGVRSLPAEAFGEKTVELCDDGLRVRTPLVDTRYHWSFVKTVKETDRYLFFSSRENDALLAAIPADAFASPEERARFVERARALLAAHRDAQAVDASHEAAKTGLDQFSLEE